MRNLKIFFFISLAILFLLPTKTALAESEYDYLIKIKFSEFKLFLFDASGKEIINFSVAIPKRTLKLPIVGWTRKIEKNPWWYPTPATRIAYLKQKEMELSKAIPPNDHRNAMGKIKFIIIWETPGVNPAIRLHGTNDPNSIGKKITRDCIRMKNEDALLLKETVESKKVKIILVL